MQHSRCGTRSRIIHRRVFQSHGTHRRILDNASATSRASFEINRRRFRWKPDKPCTSAVIRDIVLHDWFFFSAVVKGSRGCLLYENGFNISIRGADRYKCKLGLAGVARFPRENRQTSTTGLEEEETWSMSRDRFSIGCVPPTTGLWSNVDPTLSEWINGFPGNRMRIEEKWRIPSTNRLSLFHSR